MRRLSPILIYWLFVLFTILTSSCNNDDLGSIPGSILVIEEEKYGTFKPIQKFYFNHQQKMLSMVQVSYYDSINTNYDSIFFKFNSSGRIDRGTHSQGGVTVFKKDQISYSSYRYFLTGGYSTIAYPRSGGEINWFEGGVAGPFSGYFYSSYKHDLEGNLISGRDPYSTTNQRGGVKFSTLFNLHKNPFFDVPIEGKLMVGLWADREFYKLNFNSTSLINFREVYETVIDTVIILQEFGTYQFDPKGFPTTLELQSLKLRYPVFDTTLIDTLRVFSNRYRFSRK